MLFDFKQPTYLSLQISWQQLPLISFIIQPYDTKKDNGRERSEEEGRLYPTALPSFPSSSSFISAFNFQQHC